MKLSKAVFNRVTKILFTISLFILPASFYAVDNSSDMAPLVTDFQPTESDDKDSLMTSTSSVDWIKNQFSSKISLDVQKAGIPLPSGKSTATKRIEMQLTSLIKDPLLTLNVDSSENLGDIILRQGLTLEQLTHIIDNSKRTPGVFGRDNNSIQLSNTIKINEIGALMVKHNVPYKGNMPIETISSRAYTGIIIDARGILPVHGEYTRENADPCFFPKIWNEKMDLLYERNMVDKEIAQNIGIVHYDYSDTTDAVMQRVGIDPLHITAKQIYGAKRTDPVISYEDYLRIMTVAENKELLKDGKVVILLGKKQLVHPVYAPDKTPSYYAAFEKLREFVYTDPNSNLSIADAPDGIKITINDLKFVADSAKLLDGEMPRITALAKQLKELTNGKNFTILIEGHTADVGKPVGQMNLSLQRAQAIVDALAAQGVNKSMFTTRGLGGTVPIGDNSTPEGRAMNRRVEIKVMPGTSLIQRAN
ncbi:MAG: OmpA family protein [Treponema sp.]|nr:OmpA family protein [Treponema sp.]